MNIMDIIFKLMRNESSVYKEIDEDYRFEDGDNSATVILNRILLSKSSIGKMINASAVFVFSNLVDEISSESTEADKIKRVQDILNDNCCKLYLAVNYICKKIIVPKFHENVEDFIMETASYYALSGIMYNASYMHIEQESINDDTRNAIFMFAETIASLKETLNKIDTKQYNRCLVDGLNDAMSDFESALRALDINLIADNVSELYYGNGDECDEYQ